MRHYRGLVRAAMVTDAVDGHALRVATEVDAAAQRPRLAIALTRMAGRDRDVLLLVAWGGLSCEEAAEALGIPSGTARMTGSDGEPMTRQQWARADGGAHAWIDEAGKLQIQTMERPSDHPARRGTLEGYPLVASLPTDPAALPQWVYDRADENWSNGPSSTSEEEIFLFFNHILRGNVMPPEVEAAIFGVMSDLPGLTIENVEMFGSPAIAVGYESDWLRDEILLDPRTYEYVGERATVTRDATIDPGKAGNATGEVHEGSQVLAERLDIAIVDEAGELP